MTTLHEGTCEQCGKPYKGRGLRFCSNHCRVTWTNLNRNVTKRQDVRDKLAKIAKEKNYQSKMMTPEARAKAVIGISKAGRGRILSEAHKRAIGEGSKRAGCIPPRNPHLVGERHPFWKGGHSKLRPREYEKPAYIEFRKAVLARDNFICLDCGKHGDRLEVHHVEAWGPYPELRYDIANGVTLCRKCHLARHRNRPRPVTIGPRVVSDLRSGSSSTS